MRAKRLVLALLVAVGLAFGGFAAVSDDVSAGPNVHPKPCSASFC